MKGIVRGNVTISDNVREAVEKRMANIVRERIEGYMERDYVMLLARGKFMKRFVQLCWRIVDRSPFFILGP